MINIQKTGLYLFLFLAFYSFAPATSHADDACKISDRACVLNTLQATATQITESNWRDQTYRELAKTRAFDGDYDTAFALLEKIENPDTKAMTIRGIGMTVADNKLSAAAYSKIFTRLRAVSETITHPPSYAIALTYTAMAQAFAGDDEGAWKTAADMKNDALQSKAYGETAEIQAEKGKYESAMKSISFITSESYRNKAYATVSKILAEHNSLQNALDAAMKNTNPYQRASAIQFILDKQKPRDVEHDAVTKKVP